MKRIFPALALCVILGFNGTAVSALASDSAAGSSLSGDVIAYPDTNLHRSVTNNVNTGAWEIPTWYTLEKPDSKWICIEYTDHTTDMSSTIAYKGKPIRFTVQAGYMEYKSQDCQAYAMNPGEDFSADVSGPYLTKTLTSAAHTEKINDFLYSKYSNYGKGRYEQLPHSTIMRFANLNDRLRLPGNSNAAYEIGFSWVESLAYNDVKAEDLKQYSSAREFVKKTGYHQSNDRFMYQIGYTSFLGDERDSDASLVKECKEQIPKNGASGYAVKRENQNYNKLTIPANAPHIQDLLSYWKERQNSYGGVEDPVLRDGNYTFVLSRFEYGGEKPNSYWLTEDMKSIQKDVPSLDKDEDHYTVETDIRYVNFYFLYFDFSEKQAADAWAAEMDSWDGHWKHLTEGTDYDRSGNPRAGSFPGLYAGNWGDNYSGKIGEISVPFCDQYEYTINGPGVYTITVTGVNTYTGTIKKTLTVAGEEESVPAQPGSRKMYRLYNPNSGEHIYTANEAERQNVIAAGWK